jgi:S1-C subfamily serine protease
VVAAVVTALIVGSFAGLSAGLLGARLVLGNGAGLRGSGQITVVPSKTSEPVVAASQAAVPSVVNIDVQQGTAQGGDSGLPTSHPSVPITGNGSGVAFKRAGEKGTYVITNDHVVENAELIVVRDPAGQSYKGTVVGTDPETDIAVVKIDGDLPLINVADSSKLLVGQQVVAIGSPFGLDHTVTSGVVSALGRSLPQFESAKSSAYPLVDVIQTDAAINPGNSGGALVNLSGKLVGINSAIYSDTGASGGIGFAIPSNTAVRVAEEIISKGKVSHPFLGIIGMTVTPQLQTEKKLAVSEGAYVAEIAKGSGAQTAGVKIGDVVVELAGAPIRSMDDLILQVRRKKVGDSLKIVVVRDGKRLELTMVVGDKPSNFTTTESSATPAPKK